MRKRAINTFDKKMKTFVRQVVVQLLMVLYFFPIMGNLAYVLYALISMASAF